MPYNLLKRDIERELLPMAEAFGMSVAAWGPFAGGVLSAKFSGPGGATASSSRVDPDSLTEREHTIARAVQKVAGELGASAAQVAIAWTRTRHGFVHPIIGASTVEQLTDNLGSIDVVLPEEAVRQLDVVTNFEVGFPGDFIAECEASPWVFGEAATSLIGRLM